MDTIMGEYINQPRIIYLIISGICYSPIIEKLLLFIIHDWWNARYHSLNGRCPTMWGSIHQPTTWIPPPKKGYIIHGIATIMGECVDFFYRFLQGMTTGLPATGCDLCNHKKPKILNPKLVSQFFQHTILMASNVQWFIGSAISRSGWWRKGPDRSPQESPWFWRWCPLIFFSRVGNIFNYNFNHYPLVN